MSFIKKAIIPSVVFFVCAVSRLIFLNRFVYHWDGIQYILGIEDFDILHHQPHPPGFFNYIFMGKIFKLFLYDSEKSLNYLTVILSAFSAVLFYFVVLEMLKNKEDAVWCALLFLSSPVIWFYGEVINNFVPEMCFLLLFIYLLLKKKNVYFLFFLAGWILGIRIYSVVYVLPLLVFSFNKKGIQPKKLIALLAVFFIGILMWLLPTIYLSGGYRNYIFIYQKHVSFNAGRAFFNDPLRPALNFLMVFIFLFWGVGYIMSFVFPLVIKIKGIKHINQFGRNNLLLITWLSSGVVFYSITGATNPGYILSVIPPLIIFSYSSFKSIAETVKLKKHIIEAVLIVFMLFNCYDFLFSRKAISLTEIKNHDLILSRIVFNIKTKFKPDETAIITYPFFKLGLRHAVYYLPEYYVFEEEEIKNKVGYIPFFKGRKNIPKELKKVNDFYFPKETKDIVFFAPRIDEFELAKIFKERIQSIQLNNDFHLYYLKLE